ncbi:chromate resistance protein ChrB domain-containing protein [Roseibium sp.]|uniref:chromate resistance protein ChrB domain-containing protein n=1 Tax=Roseibium sp. TaxID=1936156 RepID=UPI003A974F0F
MAAPTEITISQLQRLIGTPDCPALVDVRDIDDFEADPFLIPGTFRPPAESLCAPDFTARLHAAFPDRKIVIICKKGLKISQYHAALLRHLGASAESLEGGTEAWSAASLPRVPFSAIPRRVAQGPLGSTLWVTRQRPKIDRIACPWLIRRFIDPHAVFLFVSPQDVLSVSERYGAVPFDVEGVALSHQGEECSFDTLIRVFGLETPALSRLATIVRGADTARLDLAPECAGLLAASLGLSRLHKDDLRQLDAGLGLYDAFYRWARDAADETHNWPSNGAAA